MKRAVGLIGLLFWIAVGLLLMASLVHAVAVFEAWRGFMVLAGATVVLGVAYAWLTRWVPRRTLLEIDLEAGVAEKAPEGARQFLMPPVLTVSDVVEGLLAAANDPRVRAVSVRLAPSGMGLAHAQELAEAVRRFRAAGKKAVVWCATLGEGHNASAEYLLASAFDEVHLQPGADVGLIGVALQQPFARGLLDRLGVQPRFSAREAYKTAKYLFTEHEMPDAARQTLAGLLESQAAEICRQIAEQRGLDEARVRQLMDEAPLRDEQAVAAKLVDHLSHRDVVEDRLRKDRGTQAVSLQAYLATGRRPYRRGQGVALIYGVGTIRRGRGQRGGGMAVMNSADVVEAFRTAVAAPKVRAIVFRINSPGGSANASETIWREVCRAREKGKPVVASMSNVAGSGGYYIAAAADRILAQAGTITGSIGAVTGKLVTRGAWQKAGINWQSVQVGADAMIWSSQEDFSDSGWRKMEQMLDGIYAMFMRRVAEGRNLGEEQVHDAAQGQLWSGAAAREKGLVDELGGLTRAIERAKELGGIPAEARVRLIPLPPPQTVWSLLSRTSGAQPVAWLPDLGRPVEAAAHLLEHLDADEALTLRMPPWSQGR